MLPPHLSRQLARQANANAVAVAGSMVLASLYARTADALAGAGVEAIEAERLAHEVVGGIIASIEGAGDSMVKAMAATAEAARTAPRH